MSYYSILTSSNIIQKTGLDRLGILFKLKDNAYKLMLPPSHIPVHMRVTDEGRYCEL